MRGKKGTHTVLVNLVGMEIGMQMKTMLAEDRQRSSLHLGLDKGRRSNIYLHLLCVRNLIWHLTYRISFSDTHIPIYSKSGYTIFDYVLPSKVHYMLHI